MEQGLAVEKKRRLTPIVISALLFSAVAGTQFFNFSVANPYEAYTYTASPIISIHSPVDTETFCSNNVPLNFTITKPDEWLISWSAVGDPQVFKNKLVHLDIILDGKGYRSIEVNSCLSSPFSYSENLTNLADGIHTLEIHTYCDGWDLEGHGLWERYLPYETSSDLINFAVETFSLLSPENKTYNTSNIPLDFTVGESVSQIAFSLDGKDNVTVSGNTTIAGLPNGNHKIIVYATDAFGNTGASETVSFTVEVPFPTTLVVAPMASVAAVGAVVAFYFKKRNGNKR